MPIGYRWQQYGKVFGHWQIKEFLGGGSNGKSAVFRLEHTETPGFESALKVVSLIERRGCIDDFSPEYRAEYEKIRKKRSDEALNEVLLMNALQDNSNIVRYEDHAFVDWSDKTGFGRDMLIRMERLSDLRSRISTGKYNTPRKEILKVGKDICTALVQCHQEGIIHRDIKPENIFVSKNGNYKLGDFGISRIVNTTSSSASTSIGTPQYWAPEQISGTYDVRVDIYSLGLVLYELANKNRLPFAESINVRDEEGHRRLLGESLPAPCNADNALADLILTACAFRPEDRFQSAEDFLQALNNVDTHVLPTPSPAPSPAPITDQDDNGQTGYITIPARGDGGQTGNNTILARDEYPPSPMPPSPSPVPDDLKDWKKFLPWIVAVLAVSLVIFLFTIKDDDKSTTPENDERESSQASIQTEESNATNPPATQHKHSWKEATYDEPKTCMSCGATEGESLKVEPVYINDMEYCDKSGKLWTRSDSTVDYPAQYDTSDIEIWKQENIAAHTVGPVFDNQGNRYQYALYVDGKGSDEFYISFDLNGIYTRFTGWCGFPADPISKNTINSEKYFEIYADGELIWTTTLMDADGIPEYFDLDIKDVDILTIYYPSTKNLNEAATLYDGLLS